MMTLGSELSIINLAVESGELGNLDQAIKNGVPNVAHLETVHLFAMLDPALFKIGIHISHALINRIAEEKKI